MAQSDLTRVIEPACQKLAEQQGFELVDVELVREGASRYLRIYIDKPDGNGYLHPAWLPDTASNQYP